MRGFIESALTSDAIDKTNAAAVGMLRQSFGCEIANNTPRPIHNDLPNSPAHASEHDSRARTDMRNHTPAHTFALSDTLAEPLSRIDTLAPGCMCRHRRTSMLARIFLAGLKMPIVGSRHVAHLRSVL